MAIFNSYVSLPEGSFDIALFWEMGPFFSGRKKRTGWQPSAALLESQFNVQVRRGETQSHN